MAHNRLVLKIEFGSGATISVYKCSSGRTVTLEIGDQLDKEDVNAIFLSKDQAAVVGNALLDAASRNDESPR